MTRHIALLPVLLAIACHASTPSAQPYDWCTADAPTDEACFATKRDPTSANMALALAIARRQAVMQPKADFGWTWGAAVLVGSLADVYRVTGDAPTLAYGRAWLDASLANGYTMTSSDTAAPTGPDIALWKLTGNANYHKPIDDFLAYVDHVALRTPDGGLNHMGATDALGVAIWVDSLFMFGQPMVRLALATGDPSSLNTMGTQVGIFVDQLQDSSGFFHHATTNIFPQDPDVFWGRGNGWVVWALADYLRARKLRGEEDAKVATALRKLVAAVIAAQDPASGLWWTVLNRPGETYLETSASALFAAGMARGWRVGVLGDEVLPVIARAMVGVKARVVTQADGPVVTGVSGPTNPGTFDTYKAIPVEDDLPYGIGAVVFALIETSGLPAQ